MITINTTTEKMCRHYLTSMVDVLMYLTDEADSDSDYFKNIVSLNTGNMAAIRKMFVDGYTPLLVSMDVIDPYPVKRSDEIEIRVYHDDKLIGVVIESEINF